MRKLLLAGLITASVVAPTAAFAAIGPGSLAYCDILEWLGFVNVMACEGY